MLNFVATTKTVTVTGGPSTLMALKAYLKVPVKDRFFAMRRARGGWDGTVDFYNTRSNSFSRGLWPKVKCWLKYNDLPFEFKVITPVLLPPLTNPNIRADFTLRPDQAEALNKWLKRDGFGIIWAPAGSGKTELAAAALHHLRNNFKRALFLVNSLDLLLQTKERFELRLGTKIGLIGGSYWQPERITVATVQTLSSVVKNKAHPKLDELKALLADTDFIIGDEIHHGKGRQYRDVVTRSGAKYVLGLSARPFHVYDPDIQKMTAEDVMVLAYFGPVVYRRTASEAIDDGQLARPTVLLLPFELPMGEGLSWPLTRKLLFANAAYIEQVSALVKAAAEAGQASLVISGSSLKFNHSIHKALLLNGVNAVELCGATDKLVRQEARHDLHQNAIEAVVATTIFDEGVDVPNLRQLILAYGGRSLIKTDQRTGRGLRRKSSGSNTAVIVDWVHYGNKHLHSHSLARLHRYLEEASYDLVLVDPDKHSAAIKRMVKDRVQQLAGLPGVDYYKNIAV